MSYALLRVFLIATAALAAAGAKAPECDASKWAEPTEAGTTRPDRARARLTYDLPGERIIWLEDFTGDGVGDFPRRMRLESGDFKVVEIKGRHYLRTVEGGVVTFTLPEVLPKRFSIEIEYRAPRDNSPVKIDTNTGENPVGGACQLGSFHHTAFVECGEKRSSASTKLPHGGFTHVRFTVDGADVKGYINEKRLPNLPNAQMPRSSKIRLRLPGGTVDDPTLITVIRIAEGGRKL